MKLYRVRQGILMEQKDQFFLLENEDWDTFINDDDLFAKAQARLAKLPPIRRPESYLPTHLLPPIGTQEVWASGVTYFNSKLARQEESKEAGGGDFYAKVYLADRPELFFKATAQRTVGQGGKVRIRRDSTWNVPEPELTLLLSSSGKIVGYTIGNDMSSRSIEGENPLYLPQAKTYDGSAALGPGILVREHPIDMDTSVKMDIYRVGKSVFSGQTRLSEMKRQPEELAAYLYRECSFPKGCFLMTGTGIVPRSDFTLVSGDRISITIPPIGVLENVVAET
ncbi:MAG TPA: fumarylacetoacetate hydrolase family protein [Saprospiraceae bacterium]|nr:fumarylacetoacetate hydrolase family protein [Saprospiraceae bacterium]